MCLRTTCAKCDKPTWIGCGLHIERALQGVKPEDRCSCDPHEPRPTYSGPPSIQPKVNIAYD